MPPGKGGLAWRLSTSHRLVPAPLPDCSVIHSALEFTEQGSNTRTGTQGEKHVFRGRMQRADPGEIHPWFCHLALMRECLGPWDSGSGARERPGRHHRVLVRPVNPARRTPGWWRGAGARACQEGAEWVAGGSEDLGGHWVVPSFQVITPRSPFTCSRGIFF